MARIPEEAIEQLKKDVSVERLIESAGIALTNSGKDKTACVRSMLTKPPHWW